MPADSPADRPRSALAAACAAAPIALFLIVYLCIATHGLMIDDYAWIANSRVRSLADLAALFSRTGGFYRPLVGLSFAADEALFHTWAPGYGLTNVALALACATAIGALGRAIGLSRGAALAAACIWLLNFHGIRTAVLWVSGRSELLVALCLTLAAAAVLRGRRWTALAAFAFALLAKEEAVLFSLVLLGWIVLLDDRRNRPLAAAGTWLAGASILTGLYLLARHAAGAYTPATAPDYYRFVLAPSRIWRHAYIYADETLTFPLLVTIAAALLLGLPAPARDRRQDRVLLACALWIAGGYGLTLLIPARSDLYACLPAIGACLGAAAWCERCWHQTTAARRARTRLAMLVGCVILSPIYVARTRTRSALMAFGARVLPEIQREVADVPESSRVRVDDDETARRTNAPNLEDAFGSMLDEAYALETGRRLTFAIVLPADADPDGLAAARHLRLIGGHIVRVDVTGEGLTPASSLSPVSSSPR